MGRDVADTGHSFQELFIRTPHRAVADLLLDLLINLLHLLVKPVYMSFDVSADQLRTNGFQAILLGHAIMEQLASPCEQFGQHSLRLAGEFSRRGLNFKAELSDALGVDRVGFGVLSESLCEVSDLLGIDNCDWDVSLCEDGCGQVLEAAGGFHDGEGDAVGEWKILNGQ
ncbi:MAG TPA: hypothetical protein VM163_00945 [bacterium]|nr:hypothetical protein [bacterium]